MLLHRPGLPQIRTGDLFPRTVQGKGQLDCWYHDRQASEGFQARAPRAMIANPPTGLAVPPEPHVMVYPRGRAEPRPLAQTHCLVGPVWV